MVKALCLGKLILDDWALAPTGDQERRGILEMIEDRTGRRATLITSQVPVEHWHELTAASALPAVKLRSASNGTRQAVPHRPKPSHGHPELGVGEPDPAGKRHGAVQRQSRIRRVVRH